ncbi:MAG: YfiR family protein [Bacteroidetes bacterium]|nr:YfiR family protein [Bacteroidota bacterium]MBU1114658.1 YfiR family protein [Bacteroidota bacterium]MBU1798972.1 YfiR family protein [Bacteroidota bacterium]
MITIKKMQNHSLKILFFILMPICALAQSKYFSEYEVKAAYLEKFTHFIDWPAKVNIADTNKPFILGIIGSNHFNALLKDKFRTKKIEGKKVEILEVSTLEEIALCNILFISKLESTKIDQILSYTENKPILTISDNVENSKNGVIIILFLKSSHIYFQINKDALQRSGLYASTLLLNLSKDINIEEN